MAIPKPIKKLSEEGQLPLPLEAGEQALPSGEHEKLPPAAEQEFVEAEVIPFTRERTKKAVEQAKGSFSFQIEPSLAMDPMPKAEYAVNKQKDGSYTVDLRLWNLPFPTHMRGLHEADLQIKIDPAELNTSRSPEQLIKNKLADEMNHVLKLYSEKRRSAHKTAKALEEEIEKTPGYDIRKEEVGRKDKKLTSQFVMTDLKDIAKQIARAIS